MATAGPDETEWSRLYLESYPSVFRALVATLFDEEAAADAMHDAFIEGLRRPPRHRQNVAGWLFRVALRKARDARRQSQLLLPLSWLLGLPHESREPSVADRVLDRITVGELLRLLTERQRAVVVAFYYLDLKQDDIAALLGIRRGTVAATLSQAIARMRHGENRVV
ncbi:MAG: sigma-70 family RNA polymerase sigma factor [Chloroflexi bacterium]|nr:MAG: sigma-70 family RNA polymerase sigma factor [Chloroflexota bacterium]